MKQLYLHPGRYVAAIFAILLILYLMCIPAVAQDTESQTMHKITISIEPGGAVIDEDKTVHQESYTIEVPHGGTLVKTLWPNSGYAPDDARFEGRVVAVTDRNLEIEDISQDGTLEIIWKKVPFTPVQRAESNMTVRVYKATVGYGAVIVLAAVALLMFLYRKANADKEEDI